MDQTTKLVPSGAARAQNRPVFLSSREGKMPEKRLVKIRDVVRDIRAGTGDWALMRKYGLSEKGLKSLFKRLLDASMIDPMELRSRSRDLSDSVAMQEERKATRLPVDDLVPVSLLDSPHSKGMLLDISGRGLMVKHLHADVGDTVGLVIAKTPPLTPDSISFEAQCRWLRREPDGSPVVGFQITNISRQDFQAVKGLVSTLHASRREIGDARIMYYDPEGTQTVDLTKAFTEEVTATGSFAFSGVEKTWFGKLLQALPTPALLIDQSLRIVYVNQSLRSLWSSSDIFGGKPFTRLFPDAAMSRQAKSVSERVLQTRRRASMQGLVEYGSSKVWCRIHFQSVRMANVRSVLALFEDLTAEREQLSQSDKLRAALETRVKERTAELERSNARLQEEIAVRERMELDLLKAQRLDSLGVLAGGIAHDFNNILAAMQGNISLAKTYTNPESKAHIKLLAVEKAISRATDLTGQLLTFSKGGTPVKKPGSISILVKDCCEFALRGSNVKCEFDLPQGLWTVEFDQGQVSRVINNIVMNAIHAMPQGGVLRAKARNVEPSSVSHPRLKPGKYVEIRLEDQGIGIPKEHLDRIFDPYFTTRHDGHGLGLATAHSIVNKHDGLITAESEVGKGSTITIYLRASEKEVTSELPPTRRAIRGRGTILLMDDDKPVRDMAGEMLSAIGYSVAVVKDGQEAIELFKRGSDSGSPFDVVILDLTVPGGMGGMQTLEKLREIDPEVRAVVSSGYSSGAIISDYQSQGFDATLPKPYDLEQMSHVLASLLPQPRR